MIRFLIFAILLTNAAAAQQTVSFPTEDGGLIYADLYGEGGRAVVLAHGGPFNKESWRTQANIFSAAGFEALAIDFRGIGKSKGAIGTNSQEDMRALDVLAAVKYLRQSGAKSVSVVGASMGGDYAAEAAEKDPAAIDRIVLLASGAYTPLIRMKGPKLFIIARDDANADGPRLPKIRAQYEKAADPKKLIVLDGSAHAQFLFQTDQGERVIREIESFLSSEQAVH